MNRSSGHPPPVDGCQAGRATAKVLAALLDKLRSASAGGRRSRLAVVRTLTERGDA